MSPTPSHTNSPSDDEDKAEELCLQKKREERARKEAKEEAAAKAQLEKEKEKKEKECPTCNDLVIFVGQKQKHLVMMAAPAGDPEGDDPNPGNDKSSRPNLDEDKDNEDLEADPSPSW
ncbi:hypothetical protein F5050DRAFT_1812212 [Lentinula boryana]|uniref:Uncharacterized protein n=1 Tax=Lentinula boryana TaxID=40481 RepID=A0ABQ8PZQ2_9AGAR|nr:hypothetical protein F5050DRAFT_1812212 [Lentinula boryana]